MKFLKRTNKLALLLGGTLAGVMVMSTGCEWTSSGSDSTWNESMDWVNFSGLYRASSGRALVGDFTSGPNQTQPGNGDDVEIIQEFAVSDEQGPTQEGPFTVFSGSINYDNRGTPGWRLKPGSVRVNITGGGGALGSFSDSGTDIRAEVNGPLEGSYSQVSGGPNFNGSGSVNYDTGAWSISLSSDEPFLQDAQISYSYVVMQQSGADGAAPAPGTGGAGGSAVSTRGGRVNTIQVNQLGNRLTFRLSSGHELTGQLGIVTLPGGDDTGRSAGDVSATYEVSGTIDGDTVTVTGTLSGVYVPPADIQFVNPTEPVVSGIMSDRVVQGIWMQSNGTADLFGRAPQQSVPVNVGDFEPIVEETVEEPTVDF